MHACTCFSSSLRVALSASSISTRSSSGKDAHARRYQRGLPLSLHTAVSTWPALSLLTA